jgi:hypothetical protein
MRDRKDIDEDLLDAGDTVARLVVKMVKLTLADASEHAVEIDAARKDCLRMQARQYRLLAELADRCATTGELVRSTSHNLDPFRDVEIPDTFGPGSL